MMPDTAHHTNAAHPAAAGADDAVGISIASRPMPKPNMVNKIWTTSEAKTPASTADQVQPKKGLGNVRAMMNSSGSIGYSSQRDVQPSVPCQEPAMPLFV